MTGFPRVPPQIRGDTDDEASIHLYAQVGPAKPLPNKRKTADLQILKVLNEWENNELSGIRDPQTEKFLRGFNEFAASGNIVEFSESEDENDNDSADDSDATVHSAANQSSHAKTFESLKRNRTTSHEKFPLETEANPFRDDNPEVSGEVNTSLEAQKTASYTNLAIAFSILFLVISVYFALRTTQVAKSNTPVANFGTLVSRFTAVEGQIQDLSQLAQGLSSRQDTVESKYDALMGSLNKKFDIISTKFSELDTSLNNNSRFQLLTQGFADLKLKVDSFEVLSNPELLDPKLNEISLKLSQLSEVNTNLESIKSALLKELLDSLPSKVPVYIKNKKIHYIPEFHKYLYSFIDSYYNEHSQNVTWDKFIAANEINIKNYVSTAVKDSGILSVNRESVERFINKKLTENNELIWSELNNVIDNLNVGDHNSTAFSIPANKVLLDSILDVFAKGSVKVNYADYKLGARVLGFLTKTGDLDPLKSLVRKAFLGWYDYLNSNGLKSPTQWKYNANNALVDGGEIWQCEENQCSIGIRLFSPVILTDFVFKGPENAPDDYSAPSSVSIYVKPKNPRQVSLLKEYLAKFKVNFKTTSNNRYSKKFIKVKEAKLDSQKAVNQVKFPVSLINMRIPVKDIYIEIHSRGKKPTGLFNIKAFGISEYSSYKYSEEFNSLLDKREEQDSEPAEYDFEDFGAGSEVLGDDEMLF